MASIIISSAELASRLGEPQLAIVDCRFDLAAPNTGETDYLGGHIPGATYAHLDRDLSGPPITDHGRHPLPTAARLIAIFEVLGIANDTEVVAYDDSGGGMAARLWWLLGYMGHRSVAVLDGGWTAWRDAGHPTRHGHEQPTPTRFTGQPRDERRVVLADSIVTLPLVDARDPARYRGEVEPIDARAGHIPGARSHCWRANLDGDGRFLSPAALREAFVASLGKLPDENTVHYCGSGVTACHNALAQVHAGLPEPRVYCGSWSEWCRDPSRPVAMGGYTQPSTVD